jgi:lysophospholipase L1-like esterase
MQNRTSRRSFLKYSAFAGVISALKINTTPVTDSEKSLVFLFQGDSITDGNRGRNKDPNHIMGHGYAFSIASRIGDDFASSNHTFYNRGVSGNRVIDLKNRWQEDTLYLHPDVVSILVGINDASELIDKTEEEVSTAIDQFEKDYRDLLEQCKKNNPNILFVICLPFVYPVAGVKDNWDKYKTIVAKLTERTKKLSSEFNAIMIDFPSAINKAIKKTPMEYWIWDGIHPTVPCHEVLCREWIKKVSSRLQFLRVYKYSQIVKAM